MAAGMRARLYDHLQSLPLGFFHERRRGEVLTLVTNDAAVISTFVSGTLTGLLPLVISFAGALGTYVPEKPSACPDVRNTGPLFFSWS